jgi:hypothetical protein
VDSIFEAVTMFRDTAAQLDDMTAVAVKITREAGRASLKG